MNIFLSWSGDRSKQLASALRAWLPNVIQVADPWMSERDIPAGARWAEEVGARLADAAIGIICVTPENQSRPWLLFEAGALAHHFRDQTRVCPVLLGMEAADLDWPLAQFQAKLASRQGIGELLSSVNSAIGSPLDQNRLDGAVQAFWPQLESSLAGMAGSPTSIAPARTAEDIMVEVLAIVREIANRPTLLASGPLETPQALRLGVQADPEMSVTTLTRVIRDASPRTLVLWRGKGHAWITLPLVGEVYSRVLDAVREMGWSITSSEVVRVDVDLHRARHSSGQLALPLDSVPEGDLETRAATGLRLDPPA